WFGLADGTRASQFKGAIRSAPAAAAMSRNPLTLTFLCALAGTPGALAGDLTRSALYERVLGLMLGGAGRAGELMPLLQGLARRAVTRYPGRLIPYEDLLDLI